MNESNSAKGPAARFQVGAVSASVFLHERTRGDGTSYLAPTTVLQRTYVDAGGNYQNTSSYGTNDLPKAVLALQRAYEFCVSQREQRGTGDE